MNEETNPINFEILGRNFEASALTYSSGSVKWALLDAGGNPQGIEIEPLGPELPAELIINGEAHDFGPVPRKRHTSSHGHLWPFNKKRQARSEIFFGESQISVHCRVTKMKKGMWFVWFRASKVARSGSAQEPADPVTASGTSWTVTVLEEEDRQS